MEVESSLVPQRKRQQQQHTRDYVPGALLFGVPALIVLLLIWAINGAAGPAIHKIAFLAAVWSVFSFFLTVVCGCILAPCVAIVGWRVFKTWQQHTHEETAYKRAESIQREEHRLAQEEYKLAQERARAARLANNAAERAEQAGDNFTITAGRDTVSTQVVRSWVTLEQARIQQAGRNQQQLERAEQKKQIAGPGPEIEPRTPAAAAQPSRASRYIPQAAAHDEEEEREMAEKLAQIPTPSKPGVLTFAELLDEGIIQAALLVGLICLGYVTDPVTGEWMLRFGTWLHLYSCGVGGVSGSGKTTTVRFLLFQAILAGARLLMIDPAIHEPKESLAAQFSMFKNIHLMKPCDDNPEAVAKRIRWFWNEYRRRKAKGIKGPAYIMVIDEFNEVVALLPSEVKKELAELLVRIAQSGRKYGLFIMVIGQRWSEQDLGGKPYGSQIRTSLAAILAHRFNDEEQAKKLAGSRYAADCPNLRQGHYFFRDTQGQMSYTITPDTVADDGIEIQYMLDAIENTVESSLETGESRAYSLISRDTGPLSNEGEAASDAGPSHEITRMYTLARRVLRLQADGAKLPEIMREIWDAPPGGTEKYQQALKEYQMVMRFIAEQLGA